MSFTSMPSAVLLLPGGTGFAFVPWLWQAAVLTARTVTRAAAAAARTRRAVRCWVFMGDSPVVVDRSMGRGR